MTDWLSVLRALDEQSVPGHPNWPELPCDFDLSTTQARIDRLAELLTEAYGHPLGAGRGPVQDSALFSEIVIPAELTRTRTKRTRIPLPLAVSVSNFGGLATYGPAYIQGVPPPVSGAKPPPIHPQDRERIEPALAELKYLLVPRDVLAMPYDGTSLTPIETGDTMTWYTRFFTWL